MACATSPPDRERAYGALRATRERRPHVAWRVVAPLIGLSGRRWPARLLGECGAAGDARVEFDLHFADYPQAIAACGGLPVELTRDADVDGDRRAA